MPSCASCIDASLPCCCTRSLKLAEAEVAVVEAATSAERSYTTAFWPEHGAVAAVAGGFMIQVRTAQADCFPNSPVCSLSCVGCTVAGESPHCPPEDDSRVDVQACDVHGNRRSTGGDRFSLEIRGVAADAVQVSGRCGAGPLPETVQGSRASCAFLSQLSFMPVAAP